jgi:hypothetical protein
LYDITSSYFEVNSCELAEFGYSRDGSRRDEEIGSSLLHDPSMRENRGETNPEPFP